MRPLVICFSIFAVAGCKKESVTCTCVRDNYHDGVYQNTDTIVYTNVENTPGTWSYQAVSAAGNCTGKTKKVIDKTGEDYVQVCTVTE